MGSRGNSPKERPSIRRDSQIMCRIKLVEVRVKTCACRHLPKAMRTILKNPCVEKTPMAIWEKQKKFNKSMVRHQLRQAIDIWI